MQVERGKETQVRGNKRAGKELIGWDAHWEQGGANEADMRQVWMENQTWEEQRNTGEQQKGQGKGQRREVKRKTKTQTMTIMMYIASIFSGDWVAAFKSQTVALFSSLICIT